MAETGRKKCRDCGRVRGDVMPRQIGTSNPLLCPGCADTRRAIRSDGQTAASKPPEKPKFSKGGVRGSGGGDT